jgi:hypothetical protein
MGQPWADRLTKNSLSGSIIGTKAMEGPVVVNAKKRNAARRPAPDSHRGHDVRGTRRLVGGYVYVHGL